MNFLSRASSPLSPISKTCTSRRFAASTTERRTDNAVQYLPLRTRPTPQADLNLRLFRRLLRSGIAVYADVRWRLRNRQRRLRHRRQGAGQLSIRIELSHYFYL